MSEGEYILQNVSGRVLTFGGSPSRGGVQVLPNETKTISKETAKWLGNDPIIRAVIKAGDLLDPLKAIDLDSQPNEYYQARNPPPKIAPSVIPSAPAALDVKPDVKPDVPETLADMDEPRALAFVASCNDLDTLKRWFGDASKDVKDAINKRGHEILNAMNGREKKVK